VVGEAYTASGFSHAFLCTIVAGNPQMQDLGTLPGDTSSIAYGINPTASQGVLVVGESDSASGQRHAFLWQNDVMTDLGIPAGTASHAYGVNDAGQVTGDTVSGAFLWQNGVMTDLGTLGGNGSSGQAINAGGQVVGASGVKNSTYSHAFRWAPTSPNGTTGKMTDLGVLNLGGTVKQSDALGINDSGAVVGWSGQGIPHENHAFYWSGKGGIQDLNSLIPANSPFGLLEEAYGINDASPSGQIVGYGLLASSSAGIEHAFLLTPSSGQASMAALPAHAVSPTLPVAPATPLLTEAINRWQAAGAGTTGRDNTQIQITYAAGGGIANYYGTATLPRNSTVTAADAGVHTFTGVIPRKKGQLTLTVIDAVDSALTATDSISAV
jgi:probable HAF family extracellular repeat protein